MITYRNELVAIAVHLESKFTFSKESLARKKSERPSFIVLEGEVF